MAFNFLSFKEKQNKIEHLKDGLYDFYKYYTQIKITDTNILTEMTKNKINMYMNKIKSINNFNITTLGILLEKLYKKYFMNNFNIDKKDIYNNLNIFFQQQNNINDINKNINKLIEIINIQYILVNNYSKLLGFLTLNDEKNNQNIIVSSLRISKDINYDYVKEYIHNIKMYKKNENKKELSFTNNETMEKYQKIKSCMENIIRDLLYCDNKEIICYGSYTSYNINHDIQYNDIDIYHTSAFKFVITLMIVIKLIINENTSILSIPFITGHISLKYDNNLLLDCIYIDPYTISFLGLSIINNKRFVNPGYQMLNNIRMSSEIFRLSSIYLHPEENIAKYQALLSYYQSQNKEIIIPKISSEENTKDLISYNIIHNYAIVYNLEKMNQYIQEDNGFDKLVVILGDPSNLIDFIKISGINGKFSKKFHAFLNEVFFENDKEIIESISNEPTILIESSIRKLKTYQEDLYNYIKNNKCLLMTNFGSSIYLNSLKVHGLSIHSHLATLTLYSQLHAFDWRFKIYNFLLKYIQNPIDNINNYKIVDRFKRKGMHVNINIEPLHFESIKFYEEKNQEYFDIDDFINNDLMALTS